MEGFRAQKSQNCGLRVPVRRALNPTVHLNPKPEGYIRDHMRGAGLNLLRSVPSNPKYVGEMPFGLSLQVLGLLLGPRQRHGKKGWPMSVFVPQKKALVWV